MDAEVFWALVRLVIFLPLVVGLAYLAIRYGFRGQKAFHSHARSMRVMEYLSLGPKTGLTIVQVGTSFLLLAVHERGVSLLKELVDYQPDKVALGKQRTIFAGGGEGLARYLEALRSGKGVFPGSQLRGQQARHDHDRE